MKTKIKSVTVINQQGTRYYEVGRVYNGLKVEKIVDHSKEYDDGWRNSYIGYTADDEFIFQVVNCSTDVQFEPEKVIDPCIKCGKEWGPVEDKCPHCGNVAYF